MKETFEVSHPLACEPRPVIRPVIFAPMGKKTASKLLGYPIRALAHPIASVA
jgi:hypothetical protein